MDKCINRTFFQITRPFIIATLAKTKTRVLALFMYYETRKNHKKGLKSLSCVIYTITNNYVYIDYLASELLLF